MESTMLSHDRQKAPIRFEYRVAKWHTQDLWRDMEGQSDQLPVETEASTLSVLPGEDTLI